jgi:hypothetical protein
MGRIVQAQATVKCDDLANHFDPTIYNTDVDPYQA